MTEVTLVMPGINAVFPLSASLQFSYFTLAQLAPFADRQPAQLDGSDADADQTPHRMPNRAAQVPNLPLFAFVQDDAQPRLPSPGWIPMLPPRGLIQVMDGPCRIDAQQIAFVPDSLLQLRQSLFGRFAFDQREVLLLVLIARMGDAVRKVAVVRQQQQPFAVRIEPPGRVQPLARWDEIDGERLAPRLVDVAQVSFGFVKDDVRFLLGADRRAVHFNPIALWVDLGAEYGDDLAIDAYAPREDQFFALATRRDAGGREDLLKTFHVDLP
jgi:hypothetical protein